MSIDASKAFQGSGDELPKGARSHRGPGSIERWSGATVDSFQRELGES